MRSELKRNADFRFMVLVRSRVTDPEPVFFLDPDKVSSPRSKTKKCTKGSKRYLLEENLQII